MAGRRALNADTVVRFHQGVPIPVQWRNGNAALCKSVMSRLDTDLHLQDLHLQDLHLQDLHLQELTSMLSWREWIGRRLLSGRTQVRILPRARSHSSADRAPES